MNIGHRLPKPWVDRRTTARLLLHTELEKLQLQEKINALRQTELTELIETVGRQSAELQALTERLATGGPETPRP